MSSSQDSESRVTAPAEPAPVAARLALAALCAAAGAVHLVMVPQHSQDSTLDGVMFLLGGWAQIALAVGLLAWPRRMVLQASIVVNLAAVVTWVISRTAGLPFGADPGTKEAAGTVDQMTTAFEVSAVLLAVVVLLRPGLWRSLGDRGVVFGALVPAAVIVATSVVLTSPEAANHHANDAAPVAAQLVTARQRCDLGLNAAAYWEEATTAGWDTVTGGAIVPAGTTPAAAPAGGHSHGATPAAAAPAAAPPRAVPSMNGGHGSADLDRLMSLSTRSGEAAEAVLVSRLSKVADDVYDAWLARVASTATHAGPQTWTAMTSQADCDTLGDEIAQARDFALAHPTPADAEAAGYEMVTGYVPGIAAHYMNFDYVDDTFEITKPEMLLYDGTGPNAAVVGLSYFITMGAAGVQPSQGFAGDNDQYHAHDALCTAGTVVIGDSTTTPEECAARGGSKADGSKNMMSHFWGVPGCESPWGVFSGANPLLDPALGDASGTDGGGCAGSGVRDRYNLEPGTASNTPTTVNGSSVQVAGAP